MQNCWFSNYILEVGPLSVTNIGQQGVWQGIVEKLETGWQAGISDETERGRTVQLF